jgi:predicted CoA-binding protein
VNPKSKIINDIKVFKNITDIQDDIDIFNFVTQPEITLLTLKDNMKYLRNKKIWCQP